MNRHGNPGGDGGQTDSRAPRNLVFFGENCQLLFVCFFLIYATKRRWCISTAGSLSLLGQFMIVMGQPESCPGQCGPNIFRRTFQMPRHLRRSHFRMIFKESNYLLFGVFWFPPRHTRSLRITRFLPIVLQKRRYIKERTLQRFPAIERNMASGLPN